MPSSKCVHGHVAIQFGFNGNMTMLSYVLKKGKTVVLLSTMHDGKAVDDNNVVIQYQIVCTTTSHVSGEHGGIWHNAGCCHLQCLHLLLHQHPHYMGGVTKWQFIKELGKDLVMPHKKAHEGQVTDPKVY